MAKGYVALVGSPNVGKSTIFNRLLGERKAIVNDMPGVTRDRMYGLCEWLGHSFYLIDTGGIEIEDRPFQDEIRMQAKIAIEEADVIVCLLQTRRYVAGGEFLDPQLGEQPIVCQVVEYRVQRIGGRSQRDRRRVVRFKLPLRHAGDGSVECSDRLLAK